MKNGIALILVLMLFGCTPKPVFVQEHVFKKNSWQRFDFVVFKVPVHKGESLDFSLTLKYTKAFTLKVIPLNITFYTSGGEERSRDYQLTLKDKRGHWIAEKIDSGYQKNINLKKQLHFDADGLCKVRIEQKTSLYEMRAVQSVTLVAKKSQH